MGNYPEILKNNSAVRASLERYPEATTTVQVSISESVPPKAWLPYNYDYGNGTNITLYVEVRDCVEKILKYNLEISKNGIRDTHPICNAADAITFFAKLEP